MSALLIEEPPIMVQPSLARAIGANEAMVLQQIHWYAGQSPDGWVRRTVDDWRRWPFMWMSKRTLERVFARLREKGLLEAAQQGELAFDRTLSYRIVPGVLAAYENPARPSRQKNRVATRQNDGRPTRQSDGMSISKREQQTPKKEQPLVEEVWNYYVQTIGRTSSYKLDPTRRRILQDALGVRSADECKQAIDGLKASPFHNGKNDRRTKYLELRHALAPTQKNQSVEDKIDSMIGLAEAGDTRSEQDRRLDKYAFYEMTSEEQQECLALPMEEREPYVLRWLAENGGAE